MKGRRVIYGLLLLGTAALHLAYGQYVSLYILLFVLALPVLSILLSLPAILTSRTELSGGESVRRGRSAKIRLKVECRFYFPPEVWKLKIERQNLFLDPKPVREKLKLYGTRSRTAELDADTERLGTVVYRIRSARVCDYLGIFAIPVRKNGAVSLTVLPNAQRPVPTPELVEPSERVMRPKPIGFSEEHELRPYREGDAVNLIHWKLTEKTGTTIVREPQELIRKNIVLCMDTYTDYADQQSTLEQLCFLADQLNENRIPFVLYYGLNNVTIDGEGDFDRFLRAFLSGKAQKQSVQPIRTGNDTLVYRIVPQKEARP